MKNIKKIELETAKTLYSMYKKSNDQKDYGIVLEYLNAVNTRISFKEPIEEFFRSRDMVSIAREIIEYCVKENKPLETVIESLKVLGIEVED